MTNALEEKDAIKDLLYRYCYSLDAQRFGEIGEMFAEDGVMHSLLVVKAEGRQAVVDFLTRAVPKKGEGPARKHCTVNTLIKLGDNEATASSYMLFFRESDNGIMTA